MTVTAIDSPDQGFIERESVADLPDPTTVGGLRLGMRAWVNNGGNPLLKTLVVGNDNTTWIWGDSGGSGTSVTSQAFIGAGPHNVLASTNVVTVNPLGGNAVLNFPALSATPQMLTIIQIGSGTVSFVPNGSNGLRLLTSEYVMSRFSDSITILGIGGAWRLVDFVGAPRDFIVYVSPTGNDQASGTLADPLLTIAEALSRASVVHWRSTGRIRVRGLTLQLPQVVIPCGLATASQLEVVGEQTVVFSGTFTGVTAGTTRTPLVLTDAGSGWTANEWEGCVVRVTSGAALNQQIGVFSNDNENMRMLRYTSVSPDPAPGDTYEILRNDTELTSISQIEPGIGQQITFRNVNLAVFAVVQNCSVSFANVLFTTTGVFFDRNTAALSAGGAYAVIFKAATGSVVVDIGSALLSGLGLKNVSLQMFRENAGLNAVVCFGTSRMNCMSSASIRGVFTEGCVLANGTHFIESSGGLVSVTGGSISNVSGDSALGAANGRFRLEDIGGTGNASPCIEALDGASISIVDPGTGVNISSGGGEVQVGGNATKADIADINTGNTAICTDLAAAQSQLCRVGPLHQ